MAETEITYCDRTWDLTIGCRKRSEGCDNCWATRIVHRLASADVHGYAGNGVGCSYQTREHGEDWEPTERVNLLEWNLDKPPHWRKPQFIFLNSKSDLFDERVPFEFIAEAFEMMRQTPHHRYMVLTKEPARMAEFISWYQTPGWSTMPLSGVWPDQFRHVILMVSVESPDHIDRIDTLMQIPAAMRGVSIEPMLAPLAAKLVLRITVLTVDGPRPDWVVVGCEKLMGGKAGRWAGEEIDAWWGAAAMVVKACRYAGVPVWMKQGPDLSHCPSHWKTGVRPPVTHDMANFPPSCRVQQKPAGLIIRGEA